MKFNEMKLPQYIVDGVTALGYDTATEIQEKSIPTIMQGKDLVGKSQTGSGKTFAFAIPAIDLVDTEKKCIQVLVVCPTRELAGQDCDEFKKISGLKPGCKVVPVFGGSSFDRQVQAIKKGAKIIVGTPGRIIDHIKRGNIRLQNVKMIVLDEADEMLNMGFKEDIEEILKTANPKHQTVMFSATMPAPILAITKNYMSQPVFVEVGHANDTSKLIKQWIVDSNKKEALVALMNEMHPYLAIVFCNTKLMASEVADLLIKNKVSALPLHGDMRQGERKRTMDSIKSGKTNVLVATDVAARGIDIKDVDIVFNFDVPHDTEYYIHRIGRTGRAGKTGIAITLINTKLQRSQMMEIRDNTNAVIEEYDLTTKTTTPLSKTTTKNTSSSRPFGRSERGHSARPSSRDKKPYDKPRERKEFDKKPYDKPRERKEFDKKPYDKPRERKEFDKKPYDKPRERKEFDKKPCDKPRERKEFDKKPYDKPREKKQYSKRTEREIDTEIRETRSRRPKAFKSHSDNNYSKTDRFDKSKVKDVRKDGSPKFGKQKSNFSKFMKKPSQKKY